MYLSRMNSPYTALLAHKDCQIVNLRNCMVDTRLEYIPISVLMFCDVAE